MDRVAHRGPLTRAPGALKGGTLLKLSTFLSQFKGGGTLWRKNKFSKKCLTMPKNRKGDPLGFFNIHSVAKHQKIEGEKIFYFRKKISIPKKTERGSLWDFSTSILSQNSKKMKGDPLGKNPFQKKVSECRKN